MKWCSQGAVLCGTSSPVAWEETATAKVMGRGWFILCLQMYSIAMFSQVYDCVLFPLLRVSLSGQRLRVLVQGKVLPEKGPEGGAVRFSEWSLKPV